VSYRVLLALATADERAEGVSSQAAAGNTEYL
jgi:hypothetical protein